MNAKEFYKETRWGGSAKNDYIARDSEGIKYCLDIGQGDVWTLPINGNVSTKSDEDLLNEARNAVHYIYSKPAATSLSSLELT